jgi:ankyrin repeat protein
MTDLSSYIFSSDLRKASELLDSGLNINDKYGIGIRPIISAINSDNPETLRFVIQRGADVNIDNGSPLFEVIDYCIDGMIQNNKSEPYPETLEMLKILLDNGADVELRDESGERPIDVLKGYAHDEKSLERLKSFFRQLIPQIDSLLKN